LESRYLPLVGYGHFHGASGFGLCRNINDNQAQRQGAVFESRDLAI
jgi:hypothetical protein